MEPGESRTYINIPDSARICAKEAEEISDMNARFEDLNNETDRQVPIPNRL